MNKTIENALAKAIAESRRAALEEAAKVADDFARGSDGDMQFSGETIARRIRALGSSDAAGKG